MGLRRFLVVVTTAVVVLLLVVIWFFPSNGDFRTDNPFWNGARDISSSYSPLPLESFSALPPSPRGSTLILIPYLGFTPVELEALNSFVTRGGTLILADDYGYGNRVLEYLGLKVRFSQQPLLDPLSNYANNKWFPRIFQFKSSPLTNNVNGLVFNHATCLTNVEAGDSLALSSPFSFLDLNDDGDWDNNEAVGPLPVISQHSLGSGEIILVSDPSLFINSMGVMEGNRDFIKNIATTASTLLIDQSHLPPSNLHETKNLLAQIRGYLITPLGTLGLVVLALAIALRPIWTSRLPDRLERRQ